jgi:flagellar protein FlaI
LRLAYKGNTQITSARPIVDAVLPEGYRAHLTLSDVSKRGPTFTIRKFFVKPITIIELIQNKVITPKAAAYLWVLIENLKAILVIGATGAGKTTTLNAIATFIPPDAKIVTIEEIREINIPHKNWNPLVTRVTVQGGIQEVTMFDLLKASLRQRPNYIIVGEIRGEEAFTLAQAIATGHGGLTTFHAENAEYAIYRLINKPLDVPKVLLSMISTIVKIERVKIGNLSLRKVTQIVEVLGYDEKLDKPILNEVYSWNYNDNSDIDLTKSQHLMEITKMGKYQNVFDEINTRAMILEWMAKKNLKDFKVVGEIISTYYIDPRRVTLLALTNSEWTVK